MVKMNKSGAVTHLGRWLVVPMALTWVLVAGVLPAGANFYGPEGAGYSCPSSCYPEGSYQRYWYDSDGGGALPPTWQDAMDWTRNNNINPTQINTDSVNLHDNSDVAVYHKDYGDTTWDGAAACIDELANNRCGHWHVKLNSALLGGASLDYKRGLSCHETGHASGLHHRDPSDVSCMVNTDAIDAKRWFDSHDDGHINGYV